MFNILHTLNRSQCFDASLETFYGALKHALSPPGAVAEGGGIASLPQEDADKQPAGQTDGQTDGQRDRQRDRQRDGRGESGIDRTFNIE